MIVADYASSRLKLTQQPRPQLDIQSFRQEQGYDCSVGEIGREEILVAKAHLVDDRCRARILIGFSTAVAKE